MGKLIDGDELIELLLSTAITDKQREYSECVQYAVQKMPTVDAVPVVHGRWERCYSRPHVYADLFWHCSVCGGIQQYDGANLYKYCPNCGTLMDGKDGNSGGRS